MADNAQNGVGQGGPVPFKMDGDGSGHQWPYAKLAWGPSGTQNHVSDTDAERLPVAANPLRSTTIKTGRATIATGTAAALPNVPCRRARIRSLGTNSDTATIDIGETGVTVGGGWQFRPGDREELQLDNLNRIFAIASAVDQVIEYLVEP